MKLLFITRTYPPLVGGMEKFASDFFANYQKVGEVDLLANPGGKKTIILFLFRVVFALMLNSRKYHVIHLYDAVLSPLIPLIRLFSNAKVSLTVNGLDIVYARFGYQRIIPFFLKKADKIFAISQYTMNQCEARGISRGKLMAIPIGITFNKLDTYSELKKSEVVTKLNIPISGKKILLTVGRLVKRKGHCWFVANVIKNLPDNYIYLIAGFGPEQEPIMRLVNQLNLTDRVFMLGHVSEEEKVCLYQISDLFVMPNISMKNDQEGFGIALLEAGLYGLPVIASNIEGIKDTVIDGQTGQLIEEKDAQGFIDAIMNPNLDHPSIKNTVISNFDWNNIAKRYHEEFEKMTWNKY